MATPLAHHNLYVIPAGAPAEPLYGEKSAAGKRAGAVADFLLAASSELNAKAFESAVHRKMQQEEYAVPINNVLKRYPGCVVSVIYERWAIPYEGTNTHPRDLRSIYVYGGAEDPFEAVKKYHLDNNGAYPIHPNRNMQVMGFYLWVVDEVDYVPEHCKPLTPMDSFIRFFNINNVQERLPRECR